MNRTRLITLLCCCMCAMALGCQSRHRVGPSLGIGAIAGRNVGNNARGTIVTGAHAGSGIGYILSDEADQAHAMALSSATVASNYSHDELGPLTNTRWDVRSLTPRSAGENNLSMIVTFRPSGHVVTRTVMPDSTSILVTERYRVVGDTLIINSDNFIINTQFQIRGETLTIGAGRFVGVLDRIRSRDGL